MNRRSFVKALLGTAAAAAILPTLDLLPDAPAPVAPTWITDAESLSLTKGDVFTIEGVFAVNPITHVPVLGHLQRFVITADVTSDHEPEIYPRLMVDGPYRNASNLPSDDAHLQPVLWGDVMTAWLNE